MLKTWAKSVVMVLTVLGSTGARGAADPLADPRLAGVRAELSTLVASATREGLPSFMLTDKVREGLAKAVAPPRILAAVRVLHADLASARARVRRVLGAKAPPPGLLRALAEAHQAGVPDATADDLLATGRPRRKAAAVPQDTLARAVDVLTDLKLAGYPVTRALQVVSLLATREPTALGHARADLERLRKAEGLTAAETLDAVGLGLDRGEKLDRAVRNAQADVAATRGSERGRAPAAGRKPR